MTTLTLSYPGTCGVDAGASADGVLIGSLTPTALTKGLLSSHATDGLCITDDGGLYVDESTAFSEATADDVEVLPGTPAVDDAIYFGHATVKFARVDQNITTQGVGTWTIEWQYWDGAAWTALADVTDGTTGFTATTGYKSVTFTEPEDWEKCTVDSVLAYWVRAVVTVYSAVTTAPQVGRGYIVLSTPAWSDDTTDINDAGAGDVPLFLAYPVVNDAFYMGLLAEKFCKVEVTISQARTGTATVTPEYWDGAAWVTLTCTDQSAGWSTGTSTYFISFAPPSDWVANTVENGPNGEAGFFVRFRTSSLTTVTAQPVATRAWVYPFVTGADGHQLSATGVFQPAGINMDCVTLSGTTADSKFLLINVTSGVISPFTWTKATAVDREAVALAVVAGDKLAIVQIQEDVTTEFAGVTFTLRD